MLGADAVKKLIRNVTDKIETRARGMVRRAVIKAFDNAGGTGSAQCELTKDEIVELEMLQLPGVSWRPLPGCEAVVWAVGGNQHNLVGLPSQRNQRLKDDELDPGEVALYIGNTGQLIRLKRNNDVVLASGENGHIVTLKANGDIVLDSQGGKIYLGANGAAHPLALADDVDANFNEVRTQFNAHKHFQLTSPLDFALANGGGPVTGTINGKGVDSPMTGIVSVASDTIFGVS